MSAAAVDAVRRGLRFAFSPPSLPEMRRRNGRPSTDAIGRATSGESMATPTKESAAPSPTRYPAFETPPNNPAANDPAPNSVTSVPTMTRRRMELLGAALSRSASIGATRDARRAGETAAATVMVVPSRSETRTVLGAITSAVGGSFRPSAPTTAFSPIASTIPTSTPMTDATSPTTAASTRTEVITCRRVAPSARNNASSRLRWVTTMLKVLKMMKAPTNKATKPNTSNPVRRNPRPRLT